METQQRPPQQQSSSQGEKRDGRESTARGRGLLSCVQCRNRKLRCDRKRPRCDRCVERNETCTYPETRQRGLGPRKTVQDLEERIQELEGLLRAANLNLGAAQEPEQDPNLSFLPPPSLPHAELQFVGGEPAATGQQELVGLGLFEQSLSFELIDALTSLFFQTIHAGAPMLHQARYTASLRLPPHMRPPMCLQYIVLASAAATSPAYRHLAEPFYQRARVYADADELKGQGEVFATVAHVQSWSLISAYECHVYAAFTKASTSLCRAVRIAQMLKLHQLDDQNALVLSLPPPRDAIETEERRRTWWVVFMADRFLTSTTGWPSLIDERHIRTNLPSADQHFAAGVDNPHPTRLSDGLRRLEQGQADELSPFSIRLLAANELLHALDHTANPPDPDPAASFPGNIVEVEDSSYWRRRRDIDRNLTTLTHFLPAHLNPSANPRSLDAILVHICIGMAVLHLGRCSPASPITTTSPADWNRRLLPTAQAIVAVFRAASAAGSLPKALRNPLLPFAAYMAASVFLTDFCTSSAGGSQESETNLAYLADTLVAYSASGGAVVRANALQLAEDLQRVGRGEWMDRLIRESSEGWMMSAKLVVEDAGTESGSGRKRRPMLFCPALSSASAGSGGEGLMGAAPAGGGSSGFVGGGYQHESPWSGTPSGPSVLNLPGAAGPSVMQAGEPGGLFSHLSAMGSQGFIP